MTPPKPDAATLKPDVSPPKAAVEPVKPAIEPDEDKPAQQAQSPVQPAVQPSPSKSAAPVQPAMQPSPSKSAAVVIDTGEPKEQTPSASDEASVAAAEQDVETKADDVKEEKAAAPATESMDVEIVGVTAVEKDEKAESVKDEEVPDNDREKKPDSEERGE